MIDWVHEDCKTWGDATRKIYSAVDQGYPHHASMERTQLWTPRSEDPRLRQHWSEVKTGQALAVERAIRQRPTMSEALLVVLYPQYVAPGPTKVRAYAVEQYLHGAISIREYWRQFENAHYFLSARLPPPGEIRAA